MKKKISFDFDNTLEYVDIQDYAKELIERGYKIQITTTRWEDTSKYSFHVTHDDIHKVLQKLGLGFEDVYFNNMEYKCIYFKDSNNFIFHLDDNPDEKRFIEEYTIVPCVLVYIHRWKEQCEKLIKKYEDEIKREN